MVVMKLNRSLVTTHSLESGVLEEGIIWNMQDRGSLRTRLENQSYKFQNIQNPSNILEPC